MQEEQTKHYLRPKKTNMQKIITSNDSCKVLNELIAEGNYDNIFILTDKNTEKHCLPLINKSSLLKNARKITIKANDDNKNIESLSHVWAELGNMEATRHSLLINLGGGMVTDLGGFAASTFKRGIRFINIPTTLLAMVDASVGGKTGINFNGFKNEIGVFNSADAVILDSSFLQTLDSQNIRSGYAEMLKHGLISDNHHWSELINYDLSKPDLSSLGNLIKESVKIKEDIVNSDPFESGIRKALNFGHTIGHALESLALKNERPVLHGYAVAWGTICELYLSCTKCDFPTDKMRQTARFINSYYGPCEITCEDYESLYGYMTHDKKNTAGKINFTLLGNIGDIRINQTASKNEIFEALDFLRDGQ